MGDFIKDGCEWLVSNLEIEIGQPATLLIDGEEPLDLPNAILSDEVRVRRKEMRGIRIVETRYLLMEDDPESIPGFEGLLQAKLTATAVVDHHTYAVDKVYHQRGAIQFDLVREAQREVSRPNYRGRSEVDSRSRGR